MDSTTKFGQNAIPYRILLVSSDANGVKLLSTMLDSVRSVLNFSITHVPGVTEALESQSREPNDVAILDAPGPAGLQGLDKLRRGSDGLPVVLLAESPRECTLSVAVQRGAHDLLYKSHLDAFILVRSLRHAAERRRTRELLRSRADKFTRYQSVLLDLARWDDADLERSFQRFCEASAATLGVDRSSVWLFDEKHTEIACANLYSLSKQSHEKGTRLQAKDFPRYFATLEETRVIAAQDARRDSSTSEFTESYLKPLGITSMLDVPIRLHGKLAGVVCHEHVGALREWTPEDQEFASSIAEFVSLALEAAERRRVENSLEEERTFIGAVLECTGMLVVVLDAGGRILRFNPAAAHTTGHLPAEACGRHFWEVFTAPEDVESVREILANPPSEATANQHEHSWITRQGARPRVAWSFRPLPSAAGQPPCSVITGLDITERKALEEQLIHDAFHDALTGLPNRALFFDRLGQCLRHSLRRKDLRFAVLFVDLDRFKMVNDSLGHMMGDQFLVEIARRLERCVRPGDTVARFGGDEFTLLLDDIRGSADAPQVAARIHQSLKTPIRVAGQDIFTTASIGIALSDTGYDRPEDMLRDADIAMYRAKARGGACHEVFDKAMHSRAVTMLRLENDLRQAMERGEFQVHYQPIVTLQDGRIAGFEALIRWNHPQRGLVSPIDFIRICEETGSIIEIDRWVLREACRQIQDWRTRLPAAKDITISVNLSVKQFSRADLGDCIRAALKESGLAPSALGIEITESVLLESSPAVSEMLEELRRDGLSFYLDDFGTGYSSLSYLHRYPVDTLKIDRSFVNSMKPDGGGQAIIRTIAALAENLDLRLIAEGVEKPEQREALRSMGCEYAQGFMFSPALPAVGAEQLVASGKPLGNGRP